MTDAPPDTLSWIGTSGGSWKSDSNWADVPGGGAPAGAQPGDQNPVVITAPDGSVYEVISGGGSAASILQTGLVALSGSYAVGGVLSVGMPAATPGSLLLETGSALQAGSVALNSGTITLDGASLGASGTMTAGSATGADAGVVNVGAGSSLTVAAGLVVNNGSLVVAGAGARAVLGALSLGPDSGGSSALHDLGSLLIDAGGTVTMAGSVTEPDGVIEVSGTQSLLDVGGTLTLQGGADRISGYSLDAIDGGVVRAGGLAFAAFGTNAVVASVYTDSASTVEIGTLGGAAAGALTVDAGATVSAATTTLLLAPLIVDNGVIVATGGTLTLNGPVSGSGTLLVGADASLRLNGSVSASDTIVLSGTHAGLEIGAGPTGSYPVAPAISGFAAGDSLMFYATVATGATYVATGVNLGTLALFNDTTQVAAVTLTGSYAGDSFVLSPTTNGAAVVSILPPGGSGDQVLCFLADTLIATPASEVNVQALRVGDLVRTASGVDRTVVWIGEGRVLAARGRRTAATPVIVRRGALGPNVPHYDLHVTKGHTLFIDDVLIPVEFLVNHRSILWDDQAREVSLFHVELETHDVLLANGAPAESYRDDGNRWLFRNANSGWGWA